jgi:hypothetical protein
MLGRILTGRRGEPISAVADQARHVRADARLIERSAGSHTPRERAGRIDDLVRVDLPLADELRQVPDVGVTQAGGAEPVIVFDSIEDLLRGQGRPEDAGDTGVVTVIHVAVHPVGALVVPTVTLLASPGRAPRLRSLGRVQRVILGGFVHAGHDPPLVVHAAAPGRISLIKPHRNTYAGAGVAGKPRVARHVGA